LGVFAYFLYKARQAPALVPAAAQAKNDRSRSLLLFFGAAALVLAASELVVRSSVSLLAATGVSPEVLGLTVVAVGTSLPELSVLAQAIRAGEHDLALGDLFGACTVNLTLILGAVAVVGGGPVDLAPLSGAVPFLLAGILLWWYLLVRNRPASRRLAILLIAAYAAFALQQLGWLFPARG
ncbi:MAG TPA: hypothetical protein VM681_03865, partial [Candidatus Thermoplasmatota archaeon]|nr:hypothetical protein [Candidatus Thermoplasmatota archaeon]